MAVWLKARAQRLEGPRFDFLTNSFARRTRCYIIRLAKVRHCISKCGPRSKIWIAKGFSMDYQGLPVNAYQGLPVNANKVEQRNPWTPEVSGKF